MKNIFIFVINIYQKIKNSFNIILLSIFGLAFTCQQKPSCSQYTVAEIKKNGIITGLKKGFWRIIHCY